MNFDKRLSEAFLRASRVIKSLPIGFLDIDLSSVLNIFEPHRTTNRGLRCSLDGRQRFAVRLRFENFFVVRFAVRQRAAEGDTKNYDKGFFPLPFRFSKRFAV
jgi:hypothetical protein